VYSFFVVSGDYDFVVPGDSRTFADLLANQGLNFVKSYTDVIAP
jgi:glycerophosphoryl diester phosphodiesterase